MPFEEAAEEGCVGEMELVGDFLYRELGVLQGVADFEDGLFLNPLVGGDAAGFLDGGGKILGGDGEHGSVVGHGQVVAEVPLQFLTKAEVDVHVAGVIGFCRLRLLTEILIYTEVLHAVLHTIDDLLASQQVAYHRDGYHGADARAPEDFDIGQFAVGLDECIENLTAFKLIIT